MEVCRSLLTILFTLLLLVGGCLGTRQTFLRLDADRLKPGAVVLVLPVWSDEENKGVVERVARLLASELGARWGNVKSSDGFPQLERQSPPPLDRVLEELHRLRRAGSTAMPEGLEAHTVVAVEVSLYEQYWDRLTKITRVGLEARMIHLLTGRTLWGGRFDAQVKGHPGRAFDDATRLAVTGLASAMDREAGGLLRGSVPPGRM